MMASKLSNCIQKINTIAQTFYKILAICYFRALWACQGMPDHTQEKIHDQTVASMDILLHAKNKIYISTSF